MVDVVEKSGLEVKAFPSSVVGMALGALLAGIGLFLAVADAFPAVVRVIGFILFLVGVIIFAL